MNGGIIRTPPYVGYNSRSERWVIVWGALSNAPYMNETKTGKRVCKISLQITNGIKQGVSAWENSDPDMYNMMTQLEKGDAIVCFGTQLDGSYQNSKGENVPNDVTASLLIPQVAINLAINMLLSPRIAELMSMDVDAANDAGYEDAPQAVPSAPRTVPDDDYVDYSGIEDYADEMPFK